MTDDLVVVGAAGVGRRCLDIVQNMNDAGTGSFNILGVFDDAPQEEDLAKLAERGVSYLGTLDDLLASQHRVNVVLGIGYPSPRAKVRTKLMGAPFTFPGIIDPNANLGTCVSIGDGVVISAGCLIGTHVQIESFSHLTPGVNIGHDSQIGPNVTISSNATLAGNITVGASVLIGAGVVILQRLKIGENAVIGAGSVVTRPVPSNTTVKGIPAK